MCNYDKEDCCNNSRIADGICDDINNNRLCHFDGGDCCVGNKNTSRCSFCQCFNVFDVISIVAFVCWLWSLSLVLFLIGIAKWVFWLPFGIWWKAVQLCCTDQRPNRKPDKSSSDSHQRQWANHVGQVQVWLCPIRKRLQSHNWLQTSWPGNMELLLHIQPLSNWRRKLWTWSSFGIFSRLWMCWWTEMRTWKLSTSAWAVSLGRLLLPTKMEKMPRLFGLR